jgi:hypothetical protein
MRVAGVGVGVGVRGREAVGVVVTGGGVVEGVAAVVVL